MNIRGRIASVSVVLAGAVLVLTACATAPSAGRGTGSGTEGGGNGSTGPATASPSATAPPSDPSGSLTGTWQLTSGADATGALDAGAAIVTLAINGASSGGHGPCNSFGATVQGSTPGAIAITVGIHTEMACADPELNTTETRYFAALQAIGTAALDNGTLTLSGGGDTLVFHKTT